VGGKKKNKGGTHAKKNYQARKGDLRPLQLGGGTKGQQNGKGLENGACYLLNKNFNLDRGGATDPTENKAKLACLGGGDCKDPGLGPKVARDHQLDCPKFREVYRCPRQEGENI